MGLRILLYTLRPNSRYYHAELVEKGCKDGNRKIIELTMPLLYLEWERAEKALSVFTEQVRAARPRVTSETGLRCFQPERLIEYIDRRMRLKAIQEINLLISENGAICSEDFLEAKQAIEELDFEKAKSIIRNA